MRAEVIAIGDELTTGQRLDTNSQWLSTELGFLGIPVAFHTTVCDTLEDGIEAFRIAGSRSDVVVATGGLGPTADDLTRDVLAAVADAALELSAECRCLRATVGRRCFPAAAGSSRIPTAPRRESSSTCDVRGRA
jgi:nicotinamide-nucleotide amidase